MHVLRDGWEARHLRQKLWPSYCRGGEASAREDACCPLATRTEPGLLEGEGIAC